MRVTLQVDGFDDVVRRLKATQDSVEARNIERVLLNYGARPIRDEWKRRAPRGQTGNLQKGIVAKVGKRRFAQAIGTVLAATNAPHSYLVLLGTKAHRIAAKTKRALKFGDRWAKSVKHPGAKANNFTEEGLAAVLPDIQRDIPEGFRILIETGLTKK